MVATVITMAPPITACVRRRTVVSTVNVGLRLESLLLNSLLV